MFSLLRFPAVRARIGQEKSTHYVNIKNGLFTHGVHLGPPGGAVGWPEHEVDALVAARIAGKSDNEIRELVKRLEEDRKTAFGRWEARNIGGAG